MRKTQKTSENPRKAGLRGSPEPERAPDGARESRESEAFWRFSLTPKSRRHKGLRSITREKLSLSLTYSRCVRVRA